MIDIIIVCIIIGLVILAIKNLKKDKCLHHCDSCPMQCDRRTQ